MGSSISRRAALLIVEDDEILREAVAFVLAGEAFELVLAGTGEEALALQEAAAPFAGLYTDINLPGEIDGWQVGEAFHRRWPTCPIVYASGRDWHGVRLPPTGVFLRKPFQLNMLVDALAERARGPDLLRAPDRAIRTLVLDDEPGVRALLRRYLEAAGHSVIEADDGLGGMRLFHQTRPDLVLVDMFMPHKDGFETLREMRAARPDAKIIAMSGGGRYYFDVLEGVESLGASATLAKPFGREHLLGTVARVLGSDPGKP